MVLGSWAVPQIQELAEGHEEDITFQTFPVTAADGKQYMGVGGDYNLAINVNSEHKEAARTLLDWLINESDYAVDNGGLQAVKGGDYPASLKASQEAGVILLEENAAPEGKESLFSEVNNMSELGIGATDWRNSASSMLLSGIRMRRLKKSWQSLIHVGLTPLKKSPATD